MPGKERCANYEINVQQCPCSNVDCERHGVCCECVAAHVSKDGKPSCMRDTPRPAETMSLPTGEHVDCTNRARNNADCTCVEASCARHGLCCDCIRYHWGHKVWPSVGCV